MLLTETCYNIQNQVFGGATIRDMSLIETCFHSRLYGTYMIFKHSKRFRWEYNFNERNIVHQLTQPSFKLFGHLLHKCGLIHEILNSWIFKSETTATPTKLHIPTILGQEDPASHLTTIYNVLQMFRQFCLFMM